MSRPVMQILFDEAMELVELYERCKWLQMVQPSSTQAEAAEQELESYANSIHSAFTIRQEYADQLAAVTKERDELREALLVLDHYQMIDAPRDGTKEEIVSAWTAISRFMCQVRGDA